MDKIKDLRKSLKILREEVLKEDGPLDIDPPTVGPETHVEVSFKDDDNIEVEVYAQGNEELKRLMDLAGIFHKDKQSGMTGSSVSDTASDAMSVEPAPTMDLGVPKKQEPELDTRTTMTPVDNNKPINVGPVADLDGADSMQNATEVPGVNVPDDTPADIDTSDNMNFEVPVVTDDIELFDDELEEGENVLAGKKYDYGYPNPNLGQEPYELSAFDFVGGAGKPVRFVPARSGDNAMVDISHERKGKSLKEYIADVEDQKKNLNEINPNKFGELVAKATPKNLSAPKLQAIEKTANEFEKNYATNPGEIKKLNPEQAMNLVTSSDEVKRVGFSDVDDKAVRDEVDKIGGEFEEGKRRFSFKQNILPFQGLTGIQRMKRTAAKAASRALKRR